MRSQIKTRRLGNCSLCLTRFISLPCLFILLVLYVFVYLVVGVGTYIIHEYRPGTQVYDGKKNNEPIKVEPKFSFSRGKLSREESVINAIQHAWRGYEYYALDADELLPLSKTGRNNWGHLQWTLVDSLDTLHIAGLTEELKQAHDQLERSSFRQNSLVSTFEMGIRVLGGTLAAYEFTKDELYLRKARDAGDRLLRAFDTSSGIPAKTIHLIFGAPKWFAKLRGAEQKRENSLAGAGSLQMELSHLSYLTKDPKYDNAGKGAVKALKKAHEELLQGEHGNLHGYLGLFPRSFDVDSGKASQPYFTVGSGADSFYEYLLKLYILEGGKDQELLAMYIRAMDDIIENLVMDFKFNNEEDGIGKILVESYGSKRTKVKKMHHLTCFMPGLLALGADYGKRNNVPKLEKRYDEHMTVAKGLMQTCVYFYTSQPTGLSGDEYRWTNNVAESLRPSLVDYNLRPETVESLFVLYRVTGRVKYQEIGWKIFQAIEKYCKTDSAYAALADVTVKDSTKVRRIDKMESFLLGETLKYLQLLFADRRKVPLDQYVFTTEGHPLPIHQNV
uniref:alpha-1,2-Mannosidase n=1 Tax=Aplanochytrium stocchinoi TaxID=215587 RepID=A0A7S3UZW4_9STRA|mmetsp:Transcript_15336/g.18103  ORF Transcript_15336/g.18103 Transcript_15336/m.18103 type:complete len:560 (+) Transcript_15336:244-1923(+)